MKGKIYILAFSLLLIGALNLAFAQEVVVSLPDIVVDPGETVQIPCTTEEITAGDTVLGIQNLVTWDITIGSVDEIITGPLIPAGYFNIWNLTVPGQANGGWFGIGPPFTPYITGAGELYSLNFTVDANATPGATCPLHFESFDFTMSNLEAITVDGSITVAEALPPEPVEDLVAIVEGEDINLTWSATANATYYDIYRDADPYFDYAVATLLTTVTDPDYLDEDVIGTGPYYYIIIAGN